MSKDEICHVAETSFRNQIGDEKYPFEDGRYWLFTSKLCPFAHRTEIARIYKGVARHIGLTVAGPIQTATGWNLKDRTKAVTSSACPIAGIDNLPAIYELASPGYSGRISVPVLFDLKTKTIVNNESSEIIRMFDKLLSSGRKTGSFYSNFDEQKQKEIDGMCTFLDEQFITPIYKAGFAKDQETYDKNAKLVFDALDELERQFSERGPNTYIANDSLTAADLHAFPHLARFDAIYHSLYRLNKKYIREYPAIAIYMDRISRTTGFKETTDIEVSKLGYFLSWNQPTDGAYVPAGPSVHPHTGVALAT